MCQKSTGQPEVCVTPELPQEWLATLMFMILGVITLTLTCFLLVMSPWKPFIVDTAKWIVFTGSKLKGEVLDLVPKVSLHSSKR